MSELSATDTRPRLRNWWQKNIGFRPDRSAVADIQSSSQHREAPTPPADLFHNFIDFKKAFDRVWHAGLWQVFRSFNIDEGLVQAIQALYENSSCAVLLNSQLGELF